MSGITLLGCGQASRGRYFSFQHFNLCLQVVANFPFLTIVLVILCLQPLFGGHIPKGYHLVVTTTKNVATKAYPRASRPNIVGARMCTWNYHDYLMLTVVVVQVEE